VTWDGSQEPDGDPDTMAAGVYTFDIFAREYDDVASEERELLDETGFKAPYATWVSELDSWIAVDEEGNAELRVKYMFTDDYDRGAVGDAHVTVLGPDLKELAVVDVPTATGVLHGGEDEDEDGEADGIPVYGLPSGGPGAEFQIVMISGQVCILRIAGATRGAELPRNQPGVAPIVQLKATVNYGGNSGTPVSLGSFNEYAQQAVDAGRTAQTAVGMVQWQDTEGVPADDVGTNANHVRRALSQVQLFHFYGHGISIPHPGNAICSRDVIGKDAALTTTTAVATALEDNYVAYAVIDPPAYPASSYAGCTLACIFGCNSYNCAESIAAVLYNQCGVKHATGYNRAIHAKLSYWYDKCFWEKFPNYRWVGTQVNWEGTHGRLVQCTQAALACFWAKVEAAPVGSLSLELYRSGLDPDTETDFVMLDNYLILQTGDPEDLSYKFNPQ